MFLCGFFFFKCGILFCKRAFSFCECAFLLKQDCAGKENGGNTEFPDKLEIWPAAVLLKADEEQGENEKEKKKNGEDYGGVAQGRDEFPLLFAFGKEDKVGYGCVIEKNDGDEHAEDCDAEGGETDSQFSGQNVK